jgi:DNA (cytosine-5)-methyltransferase 1
MVENVPDYCRWQLFPQWKSCLESLGYVLSEQVLNSADLGVPQSRTRLFVTGVHKSVSTNPIVVAAGNHPHVAAATFIGDDGAWSLVSKPGRASSTLARIERGRATHGHRFLMAYFGQERGGRSLAKPLGTVTTRARYSLVDGERMRMLTTAEYKRAMGFPEGYRLPAVQKTAIHLLGNAVPPAMARHVIAAIQGHS